ncbi:MAG TPA: hypothetical protein VLG50_02885 [Candidatus Saccharimonadales bacterium]|nr:hypothetical protein [Candidatus Saccharimonadales bacterium]
MNLFKIFGVLVFFLCNFNQMYSCCVRTQNSKLYCAVVSTLYEQTEDVTVHDAIIDALKYRLDSTQKTVENALQLFPLQSTPQLLHVCEAYVQYRYEKNSKSELLQEDKSIEQIVNGKYYYEFFCFYYPRILRNLITALNRQAIIGDFRNDIVAQLKTGSSVLDKSGKDVLDELVLNHPYLQMTPYFKNACQAYVEQRQSLTCKLELEEFDRKLETLIKIDKNKLQKMMAPLFEMVDID